MKQELMSETLHDGEDIKEGAGEIARGILRLSRNLLFVNFRFMQRAVSALELCEYEGFSPISFAGDGMFLYYDPASIINWYKEDPNQITRRLMHCILHFVYHHNMTGRGIDDRIWNLACDIAVENTINRLDTRSMDIPGSARQKPVINKLESELKYLNAESIYKYYKNAGCSYEELDQIRKDFRMDQHNLWGNSDKADTDENINVVKLWKDISKQMQVELEAFGNVDEVLCANLAPINRTKRSYKDFMKRFGETGEILRISEDEFDNNYYTYGISLYGNIPLIENLEYREVQSIREFVIAIDTSGSVQGETVRKFIERTYELLKDKESFDTRIKIHIIQCDDRIREDAVIRNDSELDKYISSMKILGLGKTDFRPVFEYVDELIRKKELIKPAGLVYFTDGQGIFPTHKPSYETAFIIHTDEVYPPEVPPFAMRLILEEDMR